LINMINIRTVNNSQVMTLSIRHSSHETAVEIVNAVSETFQRVIPSIMTVDNVSILDQAKHRDNPTPVSPNVPLNTAIAFVVALMVAVGLAFLLEYLDDTIKTEQDVKQVLGLPVLAEIVRIPDPEIAEIGGAAEQARELPEGKAKGAINNVKMAEKAANHRY